MKKLNLVNQKLDSLNSIKEKNWNSYRNKKLNSDIGSQTTKNNKKKSKNNINNTNINYKSHLFSNSYIFKDNHDFTLKFRPSFKMSNLEEVLKNKKLNKDMLIRSKYFEKKFSLLYFLFCTNQRKEDFKNLYSLVLFRRKILSENFIFHQYIINLLLGQKCGINPKEIKNLI